MLFMVLILLKVQHVKLRISLLMINCALAHANQ
jgi:hypothetical protein